MAALAIDTVLNDRYEIAGIFGEAEATAAYFADDRITRERVLIWESAEQFKLRRRPHGVQEYFQQAGKHYLAMRIEGQSLALLLTAGGRMNELPAGTWLLTICRAIGYWHNRSEGALVCLRQGDLDLSIFTLSSYDLVMVPSFGDFGRPPAGGGPPAAELRFRSPEQGEAISPRSDVYALGALLYCLLAGQPLPDSAAQATTRPVPLRRLNPSVSAGLNKIVTRALETDHRRRYPTAAEMAEDLEALLVPQLLEKKAEKRKPSLLMRALPFMATLLVLICLVVAVQAVSNEKLHIKLPRVALWPTQTPTATPVVTATVTLTPTPTPTPTPAPTPTAVPALETLLNQIRLDQFPDMIAYTSVLDINKEPVRDLTGDRFRVRQDDVDITDFQVSNVDAAQDPLAIVVAIDVSGSMAGEPIAKARAAAANFVSRFDVGDRVCLLKFNHQITLVRDFTTDKEAVVQSIQTLKAGGDTALYDVIAHGVERLAQTEGRRAIIVLSDGRDTASQKHKLASALETANSLNVPVYVVGLDSPQFEPEILDRIASDSGGDYLYAPEPDALDALYQKIRGQLQNQYRIQFRSLHDADGGKHRVGIGLQLSPDTEIWAEKEYQSP